MVSLLGRQGRPRFSAAIKEELYRRQGGKCNGCGKKFDIRNLAIDHRRAIARNGGDQLRNLQLLCTACNSVKGVENTTQLKARLRKQGILPGKPKPKAKPKATTKKKTTAKSGRRTNVLRI